MKRLTTLLTLLAIVCLLVPAQDRARRAPIAAAAGGSTLNNNLVSFWKLDEATAATRNDSVGTNHLTDVGVVDQVAGKIGNAVQVGTSGEELTRADNASLSLTSSFTIALWVYADSVPGAGNYPGIVGKWDAGSQNSYTLLYNGDSSRFQFSVSSNGSNQTDALSNNFGAPSATTWYFVVVYFDDTADVIGVSVNDGTPNTTAFTSAIFDGTANLNMGRYDALAWHWPGRIDAVGLWSRKLTAPEISELYNAGTGKEYPF